MKNKKIRNDIILIAAVVLIAAIALVILIMLNGKGKSAVVYVDGDVYGSYPLNIDTTVEIISEGGRNVLVIREGMASVSEASCPDLVCVNHHAISNEIDQIICLPNKVVVAIE